MKKLIRLILLILTLTGLAFSVYQTAWRDKPIAAIMYVVQPGDTVWTIATDRVPSVLTDRVETDIRLLNGLPPSYSIQPGQVILLPVYEK